MLDIFRTLPGLLDDVEGAEEVREAIVFAAWRRIAGDGLAEHAVPVRLEKSRLFVAVSNLMWQRQLKDLCGQMLFKLNAALGRPTVSYIELEIDEKAVAAIHSGRPRPVSEEELRMKAGDEISTDLARAADAIEDDQLRRQFLLAAGNCLVRKRERSVSSES